MKKKNLPLRASGWSVSWWAAGAPPGAPPGEGLLTLASGRQVHVRIHARTARERLPRELPRDCGCSVWRTETARRPAEAPPSPSTLGRPSRDTHMSRARCALFPIKAIKANGPHRVRSNSLICFLFAFAAYLSFAVWSHIDSSSTAKQ